MKELKKDVSPIAEEAKKELSPIANEIEDEFQEWDIPAMRKGAQQAKSKAGKAADAEVEELKEQAMV